MKKLTILTLLIGCSYFTCFAQYFQWANLQENTPTGTSLASGDNFIAVTGTFKQTISLGSQTFTSSDSNNAYLAIHDFSGNILWAKHIIGGTLYRPDVAIDANQNVIITGAFWDSLSIDGLLIKRTGWKGGVYVAKFNATGSLLWVRSSDGNVSHYGGSAFPRTFSISTDKTGNIFIGGTFNTSISFNGTMLSSIGAEDIYLVKYNPNGNFQWAVNTSPVRSKTLTKVIATSTGEVYLANYLHDYLYSRGSYEIIKFDSSGTALWSKYFNYPTLPFSAPLDLAVDISDNLYITGYNFSGLTFGTITLPFTSGAHSCFLVKLGSSGNWKWAKTIGTHLTHVTIYSNPRITYSSNNQLAIAGDFMGTIAFGTMSVTSGQPAGFNTFIAKLDTAGIPLWVNSIFSNMVTVSALVSDQYENLYVSGSLWPGSTNFSATTLTTTTTGNGYLAKLTNQANTIKGIVFKDLNSNGIYDSSDLGFNQIILETTPTTIRGITSIDGNYQVYVPTGTVNLTIPKPPRYYTAVPANHSVTFSGINQSQINKNFALQPIPNQTDVKVSVTPFFPARPGFTTKYRITFNNIGTTILSDTLLLEFNNSLLSFVSASEAPISNQSGIIKWFYQNLQPGESRNINIDFSVSTIAVLGTNFTTFASIKPLATDLFQADNVDTVMQVITGSFDPNDKQVDKPVLSPSVAAAGEYLDYIIRFQNTGTDTAFTVIVRDSISNKLHMPTFELLSASHPYTFRLLENGMAEWHFDNILLPDSNRNETASHGFIRYRIQPKTNLVLGDEIKERAAIYFDYNAPVMTNYAITRIGYPVAVKEAKANLQPFQLYPNPAQNYVTVAADLKKPTTASIRLVNILGQTISEVTLPANNQLHYQLPLNNLPKGVYIVQLETENGRQAQRLVVQ